MDKLNLNYHNPSKLYIEKLKERGHFTEQDLLELEDHYLLAYNYNILQGLPEDIAAEEAKNKLSITPAVIQAYAQKNKSKTLVEFLYFSIFGFGAIIYIFTPLAYLLLVLPLLLAYIFPEQHPFFSIQYKVIVLVLFLLQMGGLYFLFQKKKERPLILRSPLKVKFRKWKMYLLLLLPIGIITFTAFFSRYFYQNPPDNIAQLSNLFYQSTNLFLRTTTAISCFFFLFWLLKYLLQYKNKAAQWDRWPLRFMAFFGLSSLLLLVNLLLEMQSNLSLEHFKIMNYIQTLIAVLSYLILPHAYQEIWIKKNYLA